MSGTFTGYELEGDDAAVVRRTSRGPMIVGHAAIREALSVLDRVAGSRCTVLVTGESGTGKELAVAALHDASPRADKPLVAVNCGAIPENLVESELFGHARGAFTGAMAARQGLVAAAEGGTLFLDEVGELSPAVQVKLLRLLQQREYTPVGESRPVKADVRIVAATNRDLAKEVEAGRFREDLYWRLNVIHVRLPALRERREDIPRLARYFLHACAARAGREDVVDFAPEAMARLVADDWPGNVRALENAIERAVLLSPGPVVPASCVEVRGRTVRLLETQAPEASWVAVEPDVTAAVAPPRPPLSIVRSVAPEPTEAPVALAARLPPPPAPPGASGDGIDLRAAVEAYENTLIRDALQRAGYNKSRAAQLLGLQRTTLIEMMKRKRIEGIKRAA